MEQSRRSETERELQKDNINSSVDRKIIRVLKSQVNMKGVS